MKKIFSLLLLSTLAQAKVAPNFQGETLDGNRVTLRSSLKEKKALLVCFWATWCAPCMEELKHVNEQLINHPELPLEVLTINVDTSETASDINPTLRMNRFTFPVVADPSHEIFSRYQAAKTLPFSVLIKPTGEIANTFSGFDPEMFSKVAQAAGVTSGEHASH